MKKIKKLNDAVKALIVERDKIDPKILTTGYGVGFNLNNKQVKEALIFQLKKK